jgi:hypothetical protein
MRIRCALFVCFLALALAGCRLSAVSTAAGDIKKDQFYAVLLNGGQVYFGKLEGLGTQYPVLTEVFYVQSRQDPDTKQVSNILVKRGKEWHAPDRMLINSSQIVLIEPVTPGSRVAQLIAEAGK